MYNEEIKKLLENFDDVQKSLIDDLDAEGLSPDDIEFDQMVNERSLSEKEKEEIYQYYKDKASLITKLYFDDLDEMERFAIEDLLADNLYPGDVEFDQLLNERTVNKDKIYKYFDYKKDEFLLNYNRNEKNFIDQIIKDGISIDDEEFDKRVKDSKYDKDKIIKYINNINWINNTNDYIKNISNKKTEEVKEDIINEIKIPDGPVNDEVQIDDKKREIFNEIQENLKKKEQDDNKDINDENKEVIDEINKEIDNIENRKKEKSEEDKIDDLYNGLSYYQRLELYAKEKEIRPSNLDSYDDELKQTNKKDNEIKDLKKKKTLLEILKDKFKSKPNDLGDEDINKLGFIDVFTISIVVIIICTLLTMIIGLFK